MNPEHILFNIPLIAALLAWALAQIIKLPANYALTKKWDWSLLLQAGGMPSSHSALISATAYAIGLTSGIDSSLFALALIMAMIVIYDATGIRRQAGIHAQIINAMVNELLEGHQLQSHRKLLEVLGHSPMEALIGVILGIIIAQVTVMLWF